MSNSVDMVQSLIGILGQPAVDRLMNDVRALAADKDEAWKRVVLSTLADLTQAHGLDGVQMGIDLIEGVLSKEEVPDLSGLSLRTQSDLLAELQQAEAEKKQKVSSFLKTVGESMGSVVSGILVGLI